VIIPDANLLLYAEIDALPVHAAARRWWEEALSGERQVGLAPVCLFAFIRIATNRRVFTEPLAVGDAIERVEGWLARSNVTALIPGRTHLEIAFRLLRQLGVGANLTTDVQIAAHALELNGEVHSNDGDFGRFEGLRWVNPLAPQAG
jgi:toxin-antitoxin system PIN domain toxin